MNADRGRSRVENLLGALALAVVDRVDDAIGAVGGGTTDAVAMSALAQLLDGGSVDRLAGALGLTSSGAVRLVDRLVAAGWVERGRSEQDRRASVLRLTAPGRRSAHRVIAARTAALREVTGVLTPAERSALDALLAKLVRGVVVQRLEQGRGSAGILCRLCDTVACGRPVGTCPAAAVRGEGLGAAHLSPHDRQTRVRRRSPP